MTWSARCDLSPGGSWAGRTLPNWWPSGCGGSCPIRASSPPRSAGDPLRYRSYLLHAETNGSFSVVALVWRPGQATPIHDHVTWCVFGVLAGTEQEEQYLLRGDGHLEQAAAAANLAGDVAGLAPPGDSWLDVTQIPHVITAWHR